MDDALTITEALGQGEPEYVPAGDDRVPVEQWGRDHYSTLLYLEACAVDGGGRLDHDRMRCNRSRHPVMYGAKRRTIAFGTDVDAARYPTRLRGGVERHDHDDYDCLDDMVAAGMVSVTMPSAPQGVLVTGLIEAELMTKATWRLTDYGYQVAAALRRHRAEGGTVASFEPPAKDA